MFFWILVNIFFFVSLRKIFCPEKKAFASIPKKVLHIKKLYP